MYYNNRWLLLAIALTGATALFAPILLNDELPAVGPEASLATDLPDETVDITLALPDDPIDTPGATRTPGLEVPPVQQVLQPLAPPDVQPLTRRSAGKLVHRGSVLARLRVHRR